MNLPPLEVDYLIIGSGAVGMAFADVIFHETKSSILIVDKHHGPGGHWNDAYPFVRLHQPSAYYGVNSRKLGGDSKDPHHLNLGMCERATSAEIVSYYENVMQVFLASDRVQYFPMNEVDVSNPKNYSFKSLMTGAQRQVLVRKKVVDTTYLNTAVPSTHPPQYAIGSGVHCMPLNDLPRVKRPPSGYVVIGAGKTGIDACLWLLENQIPPDKICWVMPRDSWFQNRANVQPGEEFFMQTYGAFAAQMQAIAQAESIPDLFVKLEASDQMLRLDKTVQPSMYHGAVVSHGELHALRQIKNIVRMGRVKSIDVTQMVLEHGTMPMDAERLVVDCSASAVQLRPIVPVFEGNRITPQFVRAFQPTFSAALIAHVEAHYDDDATKNQLCAVIPLPDKPVDWLSLLGVTMANRYRWSKDERLSQWIVQSRLDAFTAMAKNVKPTETQKLMVLQRYSENAKLAVGKIQKLLLA